MNFSKQLRFYRERNSYSQEELAEKIYVTRQTISKWENDRTYPDIHNLIALSTLFDVTLDELVKGDVEVMKNSIEAEKMDKLSWVMVIFVGLAALTVGPAALLWSWYGLAIPFILWLVAMIAATKIEKIKKEHNVKTYTEILAFMEGDDLDKARSKRDKKKDFWYKTKLVIWFALVSGGIAAVSGIVWIWLS